MGVPNAKMDVEHSKRKVETPNAKELASSPAPPRVLEKERSDGAEVALF